MSVRNELQTIVNNNKKDRETQEAYEGWYNPDELVKGGEASQSQIFSKITDIREYDVPYHIRCCIDSELRCSFWYQVQMDGPMMRNFTHLKDKLDKAALRILAFDIETTKAALKFPDARFD